MPRCPQLPPKTAYMSCHFSPYGIGLSNLPRSLPPGSALMLTDRTPIWEHDPGQIAKQLAQCVQQHACSGVLLDLQRPEQPSALPIIAAVLETLPCPVVVSESYAAHFPCPVLVSPPPLWTPLSQHLTPWQGRQIWLEAALDAATVTVDAHGSHYLPCPYLPPENCHRDDALHIAYQTELQEAAAVFHLYRDKEELNALLTEAAALGVQEYIGLYQQLNSEK